jgi:hypothetical protein
MSTVFRQSGRPPGRLHVAFMRIVPQIERHARIGFRGVRCPVTKGDRIADTIALAWKWFKRLADRGEDGTQFTAALARYAVRAVRSGRRVTGQLKAKDVLNELTQQRHSFTVGKLPDFATLSENPLQDALIDNTASPVPDQVQFRLDFPAWRGLHCRRDRRLIDAMAQRERTLDLAKQFKLSPARISQLRRAFQESWLRFIEPPPGK